MKNIQTFRVQILRPLGFTVLCVFFLSSLLSQNASYSYEDFLKMNNPTRQDLPPGWEYQTNASDPHGVIVFVSANPRINDIPLQPGDFIGVFYTDENGELKCGGADFWLGDENIIFAAFGNDPDTPEKDGFAPAETMFYKVFLQATQKEYDVDFIQWDPQYFSTNKWFPFGLSGILDLSCAIDFDAYATATPDVICLGDQVTLTAEIFIPTSGNYTYQWSSVPEGFASNNATETTSPVENTIYLLEVSDGVNSSNHQVKVIVNQDPEVFAGDDQTVCEAQHVLLAANAFNYSTVVWSTSGDGTFSDPGVTDAIYYPGNSDLSSEQITLSIASAPIAPCAAPATDQMQVTMVGLPQVTAPESLSFCISAPVHIEAEALNVSSIFWTTSGDGSFDDASLPSVQYFPGDTDKAAKSFVLTATAQSILPCEGETARSTQVVLKDLPTVNAPASRLICEGSAANVNAIVFNSTSVQWVTQGDGTFANANIPGTQYFPGDDDLAAGLTTVSIRAYGTNECEDYFSFKDIQIIINKNPTVEAGDNMTICENTQLFLAATANDYSFVMWTTGGDGFFSNAGAINPVYFPGAQDKVNGEVLLTITANPIAPCSGTVSDFLTAEIVPQAQVAIAPAVDSVCYGVDYTITNAVFQNVSAVNWFTTSGNGTFNDPTSMQPAYIPNPSLDYPQGCIVIGVASQSFEPCTATSYAYMSLCFVPEPEVYAGTDKSIISGESCLINDASASNYTNLLWQTTGDGTFANPEIITTEYYPGTADILNQKASLLLTAAPLAGCDENVSDTLVITILRAQLLNLNEGLTGFSVFINQDEKTFQEVVAQLEGKIKYAKAMDKVYWPEYGINTIGYFSNHKGYVLYLTEPATAEYIGLETANKAIQLEAGWNILPSISSCSLNPQFVTDQLAADLIMLVEINGAGMIYPAGNINTLTSIEPGKAYLIKVTEARTLAFPACY